MDEGPLLTKSFVLAFILNRASQAQWKTVFSSISNALDLRYGENQVNLEKILSLIGMDSAFSKDVSLEKGEITNLENNLVANIEESKKFSC